MSRITKTQRITTVVRSASVGIVKHASAIFLTTSPRRKTKKTRTTINDIILIIINQLPLNLDTTRVFNMSITSLIPFTHVIIWHHAIHRHEVQDVTSGQISLNSFLRRLHVKENWNIRCSLTVSIIEYFPQSWL